MINITSVKKNNINYLLKHQQFEYYKENDSENGIHLGRGALLKKRLEKTATQEDFSKILKSGKELKNNGVEIVLSAPKDWSILVNSLTNEKDRKEMNNAYNLAIKETIKTIEQNTFYRKMKNGKSVYELAKAVDFIAFNHHTSRGVDGQIVDPQEHTHILIPAKILGQDGKEYSHTLKDMVKEKGTDKSKSQETLHYFDQVFQSVLTEFLQSKGYNIERLDDKGNFKIEGITDEQRKEFSKRNEQIIDLSGELADYKERAKIAKTQKQAKEHHNLADLRIKWQEKFTELGLYQSLTKKPQINQEKSFKEIFKDVRFITEKQLKLHALCESKFSTRSYNQILEEFKKEANVRELKKGLYVNLQHEKGKKLNNHISNIELNSINNKPSNVKPYKGNNNLQSLKSRLEELENKHNNSIVLALKEDTRNSANKLSNEISSYEEEKSKLLEQIREMEQSIEMEM